MDLKKIAGYEIIGILGEGGMGIVYRARDASLDRDVAVKVIRPAALGEQAAERFIREAKACSRIAHPNIVTVYAAGEDGGIAYFAMELLRGETMRAVIERGPVPWETAVRWTAGILDALSRLHAEGIVHRDLKPENIIITEDGTAKLTDFGIARIGTSETITVDGATLGTVRYMSPEQVHGKKVDSRSDLFSMGSLLYELLSGEPAFQGDHPLAAMYSITSEAPRPLEELAPGVPPELLAIASRALEKDIEARYPDAGAFRDALLDTLKPKDEAPPKRPAARSAKWMALRIALPIVLVAAAAAVSLQLVSQARERGNRSAAAGHNQAAQEYERNGDIGRAETEYRNAIIADPRWEIPWNNLAMIAIGKGSATEADSLLKKAISLKPGYAAALYNLGTVRWDLRDSTGAEAAYRAAIRSDSSLVEAYNNLGALLLSLGRPKEAATILGLGLEKDRQMPSVRAMRGFLLKNRGKAASMLGDDDEAVRCWIEAVEIIPDNTELLGLLAVWYESHGQGAQALRCWRSLERLGSPAERGTAAAHIARLERAR
jgi:tetratricopeptide (TPR) repeat protein